MSMVNQQMHVEEGRDGSMYSRTSSMKQMTFPVYPINGQHIESDQKKKAVDRADSEPKGSSAPRLRYREAKP